MFKPSQMTFPIAPIKNIEDMTFCNRCNNHLYNKTIVFDKNLLRSYRICDSFEYHALEFACPYCERWVPFDKNKLIKSYTASFKLSEFKRNDWIQCKKDLYSKYPENIARYLFKFLRGERYYQVISFYWRDQFTKLELVWLDDQIDKLINNLECVDNIRVADSSRKKQVRRYKKQQQLGCCGSLDTAKYCSTNGKTYLIGCNYGH